MSAFKDLLNKKDGEKPAKGSLGQESDWLDFCSFILNGNRVLIVDAMFIPDESNGVVIELEPGNYLLQGKVMSYGNDRRVSRLRMVLPEVTFELSQSSQKTWTDTANTAICDISVCKPVWDDLTEAERDDACDQFLEDSEACGVWELDPGRKVLLPYVCSGFGDGTFPVFELMSSGKVVGFEVEFIAKDEGYPFDLESKKVAQTPVDIMRSVLAEMKSNSESDLLKAGREFFQYLVSLRRTAPPMWLTHTPDTDASWVNKPEAQEKIRFLLAQGFSLVGYYRTAEIKGFSMAVYTRLSDAIIGEVSLSQDWTISLCFSTAYTDGNEFVVVDRKAQAGLTQAPWITKHFYPSMPPQDLFEVFLENRPRNSFLVQTEADILPAFEEDFKKIQKWRAERGGWNPVEVKTQLGIGDEPESKERYESVQHAVTEKWMYSWLKIQPDLPIVLEDVVESLLIVHDFLSTDQLMIMWCYSTGDLGVKEKMFAGLSPRKAFVKVNQERGNKLRLVKQKHTDIPADFYLPATIEPYFSA